MAEAKTSSTPSKTNEAEQFGSTLMRLVREELLTPLREELRVVVREELTRLTGMAPASTGLRPDDAHVLWTVKQAAQYLGVSQSAVYHWAAAKTIPCIKIGNALRFDPAALRAWTHGERRGGRVVAVR